MRNIVGWFTAVFPVTTGLKKIAKPSPITIMCRIYRYEYHQLLRDSWRESSTVHRISKSTPLPLTINIDGERVAKRGEIWIDLIRRHFCDHPTSVIAADFVVEI